MDYFEKYKEAKMCLYQMIGQFDYYYLKLNDANYFGVHYNEEEIKNDGSIIVCFHDYDSDALRTWELLELKKPIITYEYLWNKRMNLRLEKRKDIDYYDKYINMGILISDLVLKNYSNTMPKENAERLFLKYDSDLDEDDNIVTTCHHKFESAGESAWRFLEIEDPIVGRSIVENIRNDFRDKLMNKEKAKVKEIGGYCE